MDENETDLILAAVPIGPAHAQAWRPIWERLDRWAPVTLRNKLAALAEEGLMQRREVKTNSGFYWAYWRETAATVDALRESTSIPVAR